MCELQEKRRIARIVGACALQKVEKLLPQFQEQRRLGAMTREEVADQAIPMQVGQDLADHRKVARKQGRDVVDNQVAIDRHPAILDIVRSGERRGIAQV